MLSFQNFTQLLQKLHAKFEIEKKQSNFPKSNWSYPYTYLPLPCRKVSFKEDLYAYLSYFCI